MEPVNDYAKRIRDTAQNVGEIYDTKVRPDLETAKDSIIKLLEELINKNASAHKLILTNDSSKEIKLYELVGRVKQKESLIEKIVRNQIFDCFFDKTEEEIITEIKKNIDDLVGLRFLVSLSCDCEKVFEILRDSQSELNSKGITFGTDIKSNPQIMKNGRPIYRIKGNFGDVKFELQIKSQVDSAWADIEHMLFYKDYQFSYNQNTNKSIMNKIGDLLGEVDKLMIQVRDSQLQFEKERDQLVFNQNLGNAYKNFFKGKLISASALKENKGVLYKLFKTFSEENQVKINRIMESRTNEQNARELHEFLFPSQGLSTLMGNYQKLKAKRIDFILFEDIYLDWTTSTEEHSNPFSIELTDEILKKYLKKLLETFICDKVSNIRSHINKDIDFENVQDSFEDFATSISEAYISALSNYNFDSSPDQLLFDADRLYMFICYFQTINCCDELDEIEEDDEDDDTKREVIERKLNENVARFLIDTNSLDEVCQHIKSTLYDVFHNNIDESLISPIENEYNKRKCTESGKKPADNLLKILFERVLLDRGETDDE